MGRAKTSYIGAHVSSAGGLYRAIGNARGIGADCVQIFGSSRRQWHVRMPSVEEAERYRSEARECSLGSTYLHAAYLVNLGSADGAIYRRSVSSLAGHLAIAEMIGAEGLIFHAGSAGEGEKKEIFDQVVSGMREVLRSVPGATRLIIENAGSRKKIGAGLDEIGALLRAVRSERVKVCIDTAHALEAGIIETYAPAHIRRFMDEIEREIGLKNVVAIHANDSKTPHNSQRDIHENIGEGYIGIEGFRNLASEKRLLDKTWILEVPGFDGRGPDKENIARLRSCFPKTNAM
ncbi:MAG: deoxyribonuclease IV [Candidatus Colwellbacteria bacterium]|nr:deoxyribonuclease IV [Candidatus Colwellbacteria bacterium]